MMKKIVVISLSFASLLFARVNCYDLDEYHRHDNESIENVILLI